MKALPPILLLNSPGTASKIRFGLIIQKTCEKHFKFKSVFNRKPMKRSDIAIKPGADRNADPCTSRGCMWGKWTDGKVYVPYYIANHYSSREIAIITRGLESFSSISCIRFRPYQDGDHEWLSIESRNGCYSYVGRQGGGQTVSLSRQGCLYHSTVQHELLHALGFNHEQTRSDRDNHIRVYWENILDGQSPFSVLIWILC
uniref:Metalloendopeptidase n=1 Tax=Neolamprologus brichardi TaxID=32507 RepID=A0A3Q4G4H1_NEOBR